MACAPRSSAQVDGTLARGGCRSLGRNVVAVVDRDLASAAALGVGAAYVDLATALAGHMIDVVHVCTPLDAHAPIVRAALAAGAHLIVEKPLAPDLSTTDELLRLADDAGRSLVPVHQFLFQDGFRRVLTQRARLGTLVRRFVAATAGAELRRTDPDALVDDVLPTRSRSSSASFPARRAASGRSAVRSPASSAPRRPRTARPSRSRSLRAAGRPGTSSS